MKEYKYTLDDVQAAAGRRWNLIPEEKRNDVVFVACTLALQDAGYFDKSDAWRREFNENEDDYILDLSELVLKDGTPTEEWEDFKPTADEYVLSFETIKRLVDGGTTQLLLFPKNKTWTQHTDDLVAVCECYDVRVRLQIC